jgi:hypothetical protein
MSQVRPTADVERAYLLRRKQVGPILDAIQHEELRQMTEDDYFRAMEQLWSIPVDPEPRTSSGLVEWQKLLRQ